MIRPRDDLSHLFNGPCHRGTSMAQAKGKAGNLETQNFQTHFSQLLARYTSRKSDNSTKSRQNVCLCVCACVFVFVCLRVFIGSNCSKGCSQSILNRCPVTAGLTAKVPKCSVFWPRNRDMTYRHAIKTSTFLQRILGSFISFKSSVTLTDSV